MCADSLPQANVSPKFALTRVWCGAFVVALLLYATTAGSSPEWQDGGWQQFRVLTHQVEHPLGLALVHPLHHFLCRASVSLLSFLEPALAITLVSAVAGALAIANIAGVVLIITRKYSAVVVAATSLAVAHTFWQFSTHTESYSVCAALLSAEWLCIALFCATGSGGYLVATLFFNGLGISNHLLAGLATPVDIGILLFACRRGQIPSKQVWFAFVALLAGASLYLTLIVNQIVTSGVFGATVKSALFGGFANDVLNTRLPLRMLARSAGYILYNFPNLTLPLAILGIVRRKKFIAGAVPNVLLVELVTYAGFVLRYSITDQYTFFIPLYAILAVFAGIGVAALSDRNRGLIVTFALVLNVCAPLLYVFVAAQAERYRAFPVVEGKPYRDGYRSLLVPWGRGDDHGRLVNEAALALAGERGVILIEDPMIGYGLKYLESLHRLPAGVQLYSIATLNDERAAPISKAIIDALATDRPVVLVPAHRDSSQTYFADATWDRRGDLYLLKTLKGR